MISQLQILEFTQLETVQGPLEEQIWGYVWGTP